MIEAARGMLGVPFRHQGRHPTAGVDCIGLLAIAAKTAGFQTRDHTQYGRRPVPSELLSRIAAHADEVPLEEAQPGDVLVFCIPKPDVPQHVGILTDSGTIVHTDAHVGRVVEITLSTAWRKRMHSAWRMRGAA